jgi:ribonucleoside-diphosphate reductase alpha chain
MISAVFRRGGDVSFVVEELKAVFDPRGGQWMGGRYVPSLLAAIGGVIEDHLRATGFLSADQSVGSDPSLSVGHVASEAGSSLKACPRCGERSLDRAEGCETCHSCAYSRCG